MDVAESNTTTNVTSDVLHAGESEVNLRSIVSCEKSTSHNLDTKSKARKGTKSPEVGEVDGSRVSVDVIRDRRNERIAKEIRIGRSRHEKAKEKRKNENKGGGETYQEERGLKGKRVKG